MGSDVDDIDVLAQMAEETPDGTRIRRLSTVQLDELPNLMWVEIETDDGATGLGETFFHGDAVSSYLHSAVAPYLIGERAVDIARHWRALAQQWGRGGIGAEARGASAIDIALWDLTARRHGIPLYEMLGGAVRDSIPAYNTCGGPRYGRAVAGPGQLMFGLDGEAGRYEDLAATFTDAGALARELVDMGFTGMKIWPFDEFAVESNGCWISRQQLADGLRPFEQIRDAVGDSIEIALELHAKWTLTPAKEIARAMDPFRPMWIEDALPLDPPEPLIELARSTPIPLAISERLGDRYHYLPFLQQGAAGVVMVDATWVGGVSEARRVADLAATYQRPFTPHDCTGPVNQAVGVHLCLHADTAILQETVRAYYFGWYPEVASGLPPFVDGRFRAAPKPGHGIELRPETVQRARVRTTTRDGVTDTTGR